MDTNQPKIAADWDNDPENPFIWIAEMTDPGLPEPHCYRGAMLHRTGQEAIAIIEILQNLRGDELNAVIYAVIQQVSEIE